MLGFDFQDDALWSIARLLLAWAFVSVLLAAVLVLYFKAEERLVRLVAERQAERWTNRDDDELARFSATNRDFRGWRAEEDMYR